MMRRKEHQAESLVKPIIGIEIHVELETASKMFCGCGADHFGKKPNTLCCPVCLGLPGSLPVPNKKAIEWTILLGLALNCQINDESYFERKNYFYPDLPKGYQISQYHMPLCTKGELKLTTHPAKRDPAPRDNSQLITINIQRVHLEEDTGKLIHTEVDSEKITLIDFNRAGVPLVEIVSEPDIHSSTEAKVYLQKVQQIIRYLGISDAAMEKGTMRCEPNVNVKILDKGKWIATPIVEVKNINSFKFVQKAIDYEIKRQIKEYKKTGITKDVGNKTTRGFDEDRGITYPQRQKEEAFDYRYFPEPDIPPMKPRRYWDIKKLGESLPEMPDQKLKRLVKEYGLSEYQTRILTADRKTADYFERVVSHITSRAAGKAFGDARHISPVSIANWIINKKVDIGKVTPKKLAEIVAQSLEKKELPTEQLEKAIKEVLQENKKAVEDFKKGKQGVVEYLLGQVMRKTKGAADPREIRVTIVSELKKLNK